MSIFPSSPEIMNHFWRSIRQNSGAKIKGHILVAIGFITVLKAFSTSLASVFNGQKDKTKIRSDQSN